MVRLMGGTATARPMTGSFETPGKRNDVVVLGVVDGEDAARRVVLLPLHQGGVRAIGRATLWGTRRTLLRRRPAGPWVVQPSSEQVFVAPGTQPTARRRRRTYRSRYRTCEAKRPEITDDSDHRRDAYKS